MLRELDLEVRALGVSAGTLLVQKLLEGEVAELSGRRYRREEEKCYGWWKQAGYVMPRGQKVCIEHRNDLRKCSWKWMRYGHSNRH